MCEFGIAIKYGFDREGYQRYKCKKCGAFWSDKTSGQQSVAKRLTENKEQLIQRHLMEGKPYHEIAILAGVCRSTVESRSKRNIKAAQPKRPKQGRSRCDFCGEKIVGKRDFYRRTRRLKHKFCNSVCYRSYQHHKRPLKKCRFCKRTKSQDERRHFTRGCCSACYATHRIYHFNDDLTATAVVAKELRREIRAARQKK